MTEVGSQAGIEQVLSNPMAVLSDGIGFVGPDIPAEVLIASGKAFGHLPWQVDGETPWADQWLESSFPFWARSILEQWKAGEFDRLSSVVFSRADDSGQSLYYYISELQRRRMLAGPDALIFDIAHIQRDSSIEYTATAIRRLCSALQVKTDDLGASIERANLLRQKLSRLEMKRSSNGPRHERIGRAALWSNPEHWVDELSETDASSAGIRVLLAGSMPPDDRVHAAVEVCSASVVSEAYPNAAGRLGVNVQCGALAPETALAEQLQSASVSPRAAIDRAGWLVERARASSAAAVIIWLTLEDEALAWHVPAQRQALSAAGFPVLVLAQARWQFDEVQRGQIAAFLESCNEQS